MSGNPIFIISQHRTGSTLLKNVLDSHEKVAMAFDEMNLYEHFRSNTLDKLLDKTQASPQEVSELIKNGKVYGTFWKDFKKSGISYEELENELSKYAEIDGLSVVEVILRLLKKNSETKTSGVKYPVHFQKLGDLLKKFQDSKVLFLTRNPAAIIASKLNDPATKKRKGTSILHKFLVHYFTVFYFSIEYVFSIRVYKKYQKQVMIVKYEDLVLDKIATVKKICLFCDLDFDSSLVKAGGKESSHGVASNQGVHGESLYKYKSIMSKFDLRLISLITSRSFKATRNEFGTDV